MIRTFGQHKIFLVVLSTRRPYNVKPMSEKIGPATWLVPKDEVDEYRHAGAPRLFWDRGGNVARARNKAIVHAAKLRVPCMQMDDDLISIRLAKENRAWPISFNAAAAMMADILTGTDFRLAASNVVTNPYFVKQPVSINKTINGGMLLILPSHLHFDEEQAVSEDIDFGLQHYQAFGGYLRIDALMTAFQHRQAGGVQVYRDSEWDRRGTEMLVEKWGDLVRPRHSKDNPHHVLVNIPPSSMASDSGRSSLSGSSSSSTP
jgi:hypothetical protein